MLPGRGSVADNLNDTYQERGICLAVNGIPAIHRIIGARLPFSAEAAVRKRMKVRIGVFECQRRMADGARPASPRAAVWGSIRSLHSY